MSEDKLNDVANILSRAIDKLDDLRNAPPKVDFNDCNTCVHDFEAKPQVTKNCSTCRYKNFRVSKDPCYSCNEKTHSNWQPAEDAPQLEHKAGEVFDEKWEFNGNMKSIIHSGECFLNSSGYAEVETRLWDYGKDFYILVPIGTHAKSKIKTTVTVWYKAQCPHPFDMALDGINNDNELWHRGYYHFSGPTDVDRVIAETLDKGALAVKIECSERFEFDNESDYTGCYIWQTKIKDEGWDYLSYNAWYLTDEDLPINIEQAITEYLKDEIKEEDIVWYNNKPY